MAKGLVSVLLLAAALALVKGFALPLIGLFFPALALLTAGAVVRGRTFCFLVAPTGDDFAAVFARFVRTGLRPTAFAAAFGFAFEEDLVAVRDGVLTLAFAADFLTFLMGIVDFRNPKN